MYKRLRTFSLTLCFLSDLCTERVIKCLLVSVCELVHGRYRWAFVGESGSAGVESDKRRQLRELTPIFVPHVVRIARRLTARVRHLLCCSFHMSQYSLHFLCFLIHFQLFYVIFGLQSFPGWLLSRVVFFPERRFPERRFPDGHFPGKTFPGWSFPGWDNLMINLQAHT